MFLSPSDPLYVLIVDSVHSRLGWLIDSGTSFG
jgi:hypothetical protein